MGLTLIEVDKRGALHDNSLFSQLTVTYFIDLKILLIVSLLIMILILAGCAAQVYGGVGDKMLYEDYPEYSDR